MNSYAQSWLRLDVHDGEHSLVQNRVARVLRRLRVRAHLSQNVVHLFTCLHIVLAKYAQQTQYSHLKKWITDATHVVIRTVAGQEQVLQDAHKVWHQLYK